MSLRESKRRPPACLPVALGGEKGANLGFEELFLRGGNVWRQRSSRCRADGDRRCTWRQIRCTGLDPGFHGRDIRVRQLALGRHFQVVILIVHRFDDQAGFGMPGYDGCAAVAAFQHVWHGVEPQPALHARRVTRITVRCEDSLSVRRLFLGGQRERQREGAEDRDPRDERA